MGKKKLHPQGEPNRNRRNGKAWKIRVCGIRHASDDRCKTCENKAMERTLAAAARRLAKQNRKSLEVQA